MHIQIDLHIEWSSFCIVIILSPRSLWTCFISSLPLSALQFLCLHDFIVASSLQRTSVTGSNISPWNLDSFQGVLVAGSDCLPPALKTRHSCTHLLLHLGFHGRKAQVESWNESCSLIQQVLISALREPPPPRCYIMSHHKDRGKVRYSCFCTHQCQPKIETVKYHGSSCCSALCSPNSETKVMRRKICARVLLHLCSKKAEKQN